VRASSGLELRLASLLTRPHNADKSNVSIPSAAFKRMSRLPMAAYSEQTHPYRNQQRTLLHLVLIGLALVLAGCNLTTADRLPTPAPTVDLPTVEILDPPNNRQIIDGTEFFIDIVALDNTAGIARIELYVDGTLLNSATPETPGQVQVFRVQMNWIASGVGLHVLEAIAYRADETRSDPAGIIIEVLPRA